MPACKNLEPRENGDWGPESPAAAWLAALQFNVPQVNETVVGGLDVTLGPLTCSGVSLRTLQSSVIEPANANGVQVNAGGVAGQCNGPIRYHYSFVNGGGDLNVNVAGADARVGVKLRENASSSVEEPAAGEAASLSAAAEAESAASLISTFMPPPTLPSLRLSCCSASLAEVDISLSGGVALYLLNKFRDAIAALVKREVSAAACAAMQSVVNETLTNALHHGVEEAIVPFVDAGEKFNISGAALIDGTRDKEEEGDYGHGDAMGTSGMYRKGRVEIADTRVGSREHREQVEEEQKTVNMETNPMVRALEVVVAILASDSMPDFNLEYFVELVTNAADNGSADVPASLLERNFTLPVADYGNITMTVHDIDIAGLDSMRMPYGLHAVSTDTANVSMRIDRVDAYANVSIAVAPNNSTSIHGAVLKEDFNVHVDARNVTTSTALLLKLAQEPLSKLTFDDLNMPCIAKSVVDAAVPYVDTSMYVENVTLTPMSSRHNSAGGLEESLDAVINDVLEVATHNFEDAIHYGLIGVSTELLQERLNETLVSTITRAANQTCTAESNINISPVDKYGMLPQVALIASCMCWALALLLACASAAVNVMRDGYQWRGVMAVADATQRGGEGEEGEEIMGGAGIGGGEGMNEPLMRDERESPPHGVLIDGEGSTAKYLSFALPPEDGVASSGKSGGDAEAGGGVGAVGAADGGDGNGRIRPRCGSSRSLAKKLTASFVLSFVLSVLGTMFLFISSNTSLGANVMAAITVEASDDKDSAYVNTPPLFQFTLENSVRDMWHAKVYSLALLIAAFSGTWPYVKLLTLLIVPFLPPHGLSPRWRAKILGTVDYLGKWSLIDAFVMILFIVTFKMDISVHVPSIGEAALQIYISPQRGFYLFLLATVLSLLLGHIAVYVNREVASTAPARRGLSGVSRATAAILGHFTRTDAARERERLILVLSGFTLAIAFFVKIVKFEIEGLAGVVLGHKASRFYAIETLTSTVMAMRWPGQEIREVVGLYVITSALLLFTLVMPLLQFASLYALAAKRHMRLETVERLVYISEICGTWSSLDVFSVSILASVTQIEPFSQFIVGKKCNLVNSFIRTYLGDLTTEPVCFMVKAHFIPGFAVLVIATAASLVVGHIGTLSARRRINV